MGGVGWPGGRRQQNFYMLGSMGLAVPIALGVAIAQPRRRVFALEGDGSILMQLGSLSTVAARGQKNLCIVIMDNGAYQITGGQQTATGAGGGYRRDRAGLGAWRRAPGRRMRMRSWNWSGGR